MSEAKVILGDCLEVLKTLPRDAVIVSDPPYGVKNNCDYSRFSGGFPWMGGNRGTRFTPIQGDSDPFDPTPWLTFKKVALFGANYFAGSLPVGTWLVWLKKRDNSIGKFLSDCELCWMRGGVGVYLHRHVWAGCDRQSEKGKTLHPTQKPVAVMKWVIGRMKLPANSLIVDPYCGSGSTGVAAVELGHRFIGVELSPEYHAIASRRVAAAEPVLEAAA